MATIIDQPLLDSFKLSPACEYCGLPNRFGLDPHHYHCRGFGGGSRLDVRLNLIALCPFGTGGDCHQKAQRNEIPKLRILMIIAEREGVSIDWLDRHLYELLRTPNRPIAGLTDSA